MAGDTLTGAELLCRALRRHGVEVVFGIPGGAIMPFYHALGAPDAGLRHVLCRHEQGAGHAAQGYARASGRIGVCIATSGPGATNLVTPIADAWMDGTPLLAITGQVPSHLLGTDAFQEIDIIGITLPIVKHSRLVCAADEIEDAVSEAIRIATEGRPGPVLLDITKDAQQGRAQSRPSTDRLVSRAAVERSRSPLPAARFLQEALALLAQSKRPVVLAGHGVIQSGAAQQLVSLAERMDLPVATTLLGLGAIPQEHRLSIGLAGMHGSVAVNRALQTCDVLFSIGARFDDRVTGPTARFAPRATVIHLDIEPSQIGKTIPTAIELVGDARSVLESMLEQAPVRRGSDWLQEIEGTAVARGRSEESAGPGGTLPPREVYRALDAAWQGGEPVLVVSDVGQHQMWAAQWLSWHTPGTQLTSGGAGTMGFAVPAALGAAIARPDATVWAIVGDGGFQMTNQELATVVQEGVRNLRIAVINNGYLGMVRQWQQLFHDRRYSGTPLSGPDFPALARSYGLEAVAVEHTEELASVLDHVSGVRGSVLIDFRVEREANVFPMVPPGAAIDAMIGPAVEVA